MKKELRKEISDIFNNPMFNHNSIITGIVNLIKRERYEVSKEIFNGFGDFIQLEELNRANGIHGQFNSLHEGIAVLREEYLELQKEIFLKEADLVKVQEEALQLSAMGMKMWLKAEELKQKE